MELTWEWAEEWQEKANIKKEYTDPKWKWDCNFKLDFDGGIVSVTSRFYPPRYNISKKWEGTLHIKVGNRIVNTTTYKNESIDKIKEEVESFIRHYTKIIESKLLNP